MNKDDDIPFFKPEEQKEEKNVDKTNSEMKKPDYYCKKKPTCRQRIRFWFCDRLGLVPMEDFDDIFHAVDDLAVLVYRNMKIMTNFHRAQADFDKRVAERLHFDKIIDSGNEERGVYQ